MSDACRYQLEVSKAGTIRKIVQFRGYITKDTTWCPVVHVYFVGRSQKVVQRVLVKEFS